MSDIVSEIAEWVAIAKGDKCALCKGTGKIRGGQVTCPKCGGNKAVAKDANESLATILRHDEDHDNWHRMHGDEPCTSEADCAEKRAKYAEVKAEVAKSAGEILAEIEQWRIQKGDVQGHEFHGNQYAAASVGILRDLAEKATAANEKARLATDVLGVSGPRTDRRGDFNRSVHPYSTPRYLQSQTDNAKEHNDGIARTATALADRIEADPSKTLSEHLGEFRENIARLRSDGQFNTGVDNYDTGAAAFRAANVAQAVHDQLQTAQMVDTDKPRVVKATEIAKGDTPGHEFHGNQYSSNPHDSQADDERRMGAGWSAAMQSAHARDLVQHGRTGGIVANAHRATAFEHRIAGQVLGNALAKETDPEKRGLIKAAIKAHDSAANLHDWVAGQHDSASGILDSAILRDNTMLARGASTIAANMSDATGVDTGTEFRNRTWFNTVAQPE
jgi:hypothetical protein